MLFSACLHIRLSKIFGQDCETETPTDDSNRRIHCQKMVVESSKDQYLIPLIVYSPVESKHPRPTLMIGYGAYGVSVPTQYDSHVSIYLKRGWVVAFACTRGGGELGKLHHQRCFG